MLHFKQEGLLDTEEGAKLPVHPFPMRQCESVFHFCLGNVSRAQGDAGHTHSASAHTVPQQEDCLQNRRPNRI